MGQNNTVTLADVNETLANQGETLKDTNTSIKSLVGKISDSMEASEKNRLKELEDKREGKVAPPSKNKAYEAGVSTRETMMALPMFLMNPLKFIAPLLAGFTAAGLALAGMRGWEVKAIKNIKSLGTGLKNLIPESVVKSLRRAFVNQRASILKMFGFDTKLKVFGSVTDTTLKTPLTTQIASRFASLRNSYMLKYFGIGMDGKATTAITGSGKAILSIQDAFAKIFMPFKSFASGITSFIKGAGAPMFEFLGKIGKGAGGIAKLAGKILWPIGIVMSLFDGMNAFKEEEGTFYEKLSAGVGAAVGDFIGAPLDLLKNAVAWVIGKFGFDETSDAIKSFSIEEKLGDLINGIMLMPKKAIDWIKTLFSDPTEALADLWKGLTGTFTSVLDILWMPVNKGIDWVTKKFGWRDEDAPDFNLREWLTEKITSIVATVKSYIPTAESIKAGVYNGISALPGGQTVLDFLGIEAPTQKVSKAEQDATFAAEWMPPASALPAKVLKNSAPTASIKQLMTSDAAYSTLEQNAKLAAINASGAGGGNVSMDDNSTTVTNTSGIVMPRGATVDLLDGGFALGMSRRNG